MRIPTPLLKETFNNVFSVNVWCAVLDDRLIGLFTLAGRLTREAYLKFLQEELPRLLEDVPLNKQGHMHFQHDGAPHFSCEVRNFLNYCFPGRWFGRGGPHNWPARPPDLSPLDYCVWGWMKELVYSVKVVTRDALLGRILDTADRIRNSCNEQLTQFTTERQPVLLPDVAFSKASFKHRSVQIKSNFTKLTLHIYFKCIMYYAGLLFRSVYCQ